MDAGEKRRIPLVFACAGCSYAGRLAYELAQELDRRGHAEMSCLAGVGAGKPSFSRILVGREVWIVDGCPIECGVGVFEQAGARVTRHIRLHDYGIKKKEPPADGVDFERLIARVLDAQNAGAV